MVSLENLNVVCCVEEDGNSRAKSMTAFLSTAAWEDIMISHKMMKIGLLSSLSGFFVPGCRQSSLDLGERLERAPVLWSSGAGGGVSPAGAGGCAAVVQSVYLCTVI